MIVSFEGIDGCGKSTQARMFSKYLKKKGFSPVLFEEPGETKIGEKIRKILLKSKVPISPYCELFLYLASRAQLVSELIIPFLNNPKYKNKIIIMDRYFDSTIAYQGYGRGLSIEFIEFIHKKIIKSLIPEITFLIDEKPEKLSSILKNKRKDRIEKEPLDFQKKVRNGYLKIAKKEKKRIKIIKRGKTIEETFKKIVGEWENFINEFRRNKKFFNSGRKKG